MCHTPISRRFPLLVAGDSGSANFHSLRVVSIVPFLPFGPFKEEGVKEEKKTLNFSILHRSGTQTTIYLLLLDVSIIGRRLVIDQRITRVE